MGSAALSILPRRTDGLAVSGQVLATNMATGGTSYTWTVSTEGMDSSQLHIFFLAILSLYSNGSAIYVGE